MDYSSYVLDCKPLGIGTKDFVSLLNKRNIFLELGGIEMHLRGLLAQNDDLLQSLQWGPPKWQPKLWETPLHLDPSCETLEAVNPNPRTPNASEP